MSDVHHEKEQRARKAYTCDECQRPIKPGTVYSYCSWLYEGASYVTRLCLRCKRAWRRAWQRWGWSDPNDSPGIGWLCAFLWDNRWDRTWEREKEIRDRVKRLRAEGKHELAERWERARG